MSVQNYFTPVNVTSNPDSYQLHTNAYELDTEPNLDLSAQNYYNYYEIKYQKQNDFSSDHKRTLHLVWACKLSF